MRQAPFVISFTLCFDNEAKISSVTTKVNVRTGDGTQDTWYNVAGSAARLWSKGAQDPAVLMPSSSLGMSLVDNES